jgi:hypothetical protein
MIAKIAKAILALSFAIAKLMACALALKRLNHLLFCPD